MESVTIERAAETDAELLGALMRRILRDEGVEINYVVLDEKLVLDGYWPVTPAERAAVERVLHDE